MLQDPSNRQEIRRLDSQSNEFFKLQKIKKLYFSVFN